jgi:hypothetical protein
VLNWRKQMILAVLAGAVLVGDVIAATRLWLNSIDQFGAPFWPAVQPGYSVVIFYASSPKDDERRVDHAIALYARGAIDRILIVGGYRADRGYNGAAELAARARTRISAPNIVAHDHGSYDTLSNLDAICQLEREVPKKALILLSDPLHLARIWPQRHRLGCVSDPLIGYESVRTTRGPLWKWYLVHKHWVAKAGLSLLGERLYRIVLREWRRRQAT